MESEIYNIKEFLEEDKKKKTRAKPRTKVVQEERKSNWKLKAVLAIMLFIGFVAGVAYSAERYVVWRAEHEWQVPVEWIGFVRNIGPIDATEVGLGSTVQAQELVKEPEVVAKESWTGKVSYYSSGEGCVGCDPNEIMANGQKFDENAMTLAFNKLPLNSRVRVTNLDNGANIIATVTDTGGFEAYGRIADLSKGLMQELHAFTDTSDIRIEAL